MKNIHILPTDKPSRLLYLGTSKELTLLSLALTFRTFERSTQHIYITSDEEIKEENWCYNSINNNVYKKEIDKLSFAYEYKIILTTDQDLIKDGVQKIADDFLEWFIKNPSCEEVSVGIWSNLAKDGYLYHIIIPKEEQKQHLIDIMRGDEELGLYEEPKQETLEVLAKEFYSDENQLMERIAFKRGYTECEERMYSQEDMQEYAEFCIRCNQKELPCIIAKDWFEQFKKK